VCGARLRVRVARYGARTAAEFYGGENAERAVILLVESAKGIQNLEGILAPDGLDAILLG
jgi:2-keto-3-deoxy-L-rhamnonate aldolase RhmA